MPRPAIDGLSVLAGAAALAYPVLVYAAAVPPILLIAISVICLVGRLTVGGHGRRARHEWLIWGAAVAGVAGVLLVSPLNAALVYPVFINLGLASVFAASLVFPPSIIERIARLSDPDLPPRAVRYTRHVTMVWVAFLLCNALISLATAVWGTLAQWTLWNGLLSYLAMGILFAAEYAVRRVVRRGIARQMAQPVPEPASVSVPKPVPGSITESIPKSISSGLAG
jgi:uncharacterized membrane protein